MWYRFEFQSPIGRVSGCNRRNRSPLWIPQSFSPLLVGSVVATLRSSKCRRRRSCFSPLLVGSVVAT